MLYGGGFGVLLFFTGGDMMFGQNAMTPYFAGPTSNWNEWTSRAFGGQLIALASGYFFGGKDASTATGKFYCKINTVGLGLMIPLMVYGAFSGDSSFNATMWKIQIPVHLAVTYSSFKAGFGGSDKKA